MEGFSYSHFTTAPIILSFLMPEHLILNNAVWKAMEWDGIGKEISVTMLRAPSVLIINRKIIDFAYDRYFLVV